ncbi:heme ABC transporter ATP-binding protein [endosymbiont 'TC1' of Trimyema compressum]|uniref:ABC transporter ATP-binding protein n=1 Tax=endosymbiont 'TC1' of Trimyema compressum TaxID=243899 RepID=UPI0007F17DEE|nr:ABC transporter ATP-binding protein [endosymbiont 'TC1' of Trimyema compressum]AMP19849.1 heme ABC transporter ATP-binding protein [endosymbiont 'TC1' of Trimyema compressum]
MATILEMKKIVKQFPDVLANDDVNFKVEKGSVHALMGENGAGKSTLMNILYGLYEPASGDIFLNGNKVKIDSPKVAIEMGIGMVHQHFMLIPAISVIENVVLEKKGNKQVLDLKTAAKEFVALGKQYNMTIDPWALVGDLTVGEQQRIEILKAIYRGAEILILDEPTAVLTPQEVKELFKIMNQLRDEGKTLIFISHKLNEVLTICDEITVLRLGKTQDTLPAKGTTKETLAELMVGRKILVELKKGPYKPGNPVLEMQNVSTPYDEHQHGALQNINLTIRENEVLGIAGVDGNGQDALIESITGLCKVEPGGHIKIKGEDMTNASARKVLEKKVSHVPADRHKRGMVSDMSIAENMLLVSYYHPPYSSKGLLHWKFINKKSEELVKEFNVKTPNIEEFAGKLSGGNQQKMVLGRELDREPDFLIVAYPVRGLDIGATEYIHERILAERDRGCGVLLVSTELDEILSLSDRVAVMYEGKIMGILEKAEFDVTEIGMMMAGTKRHTEEVKENIIAV